MIYNSDDIQKIIPHRYPFLLVDRIESIEGNKVVGIKCISANEMQFSDIFRRRQLCRVSCSWRRWRRPWQLCC